MAVSARPLDAPLSPSRSEIAFFRFALSESRMTLLAIIWLASFAVLVEAFADAPLIERPGW
jgi:hypothetical protein